MIKVKQLPPPSPEVLHIPTILRRVQQGEIRAPAFQRNYVWDEKQVLELLESIYKGYPIGSLLLWQTDAFELSTSSRFPFPTASAQKPTHFILDGMQRLATIYNCFFSIADIDPDIARLFAVSFDLKRLAFIPSPKKREDHQLPLRSLFAPKEFLQEQQTISKLADGEQLLDAAIALHASFQEYMIPVVTIRDRPLESVVAIFERVNSTGTRLSGVDFMRAVTWSTSFDLTKSLGRLSSSLAETGFEIPPETLVKVVAICDGRSPILESMLELREADTKRLNIALRLAEQALARAVDFLKRELGIYSYGFVPYEAQLLVLARLFRGESNPSKSARGHVRDWFVAVSAGEALQGKSESAIASLVNDVGALLAGRHALPARVLLEPADLMYRKFIAGRAMSCGIAMLHAMSGARSLVTGKVIHPGDFTSIEPSAVFAPVVSQAQLSKQTGIPFDTSRLVCNVVLVAAEDRSLLAGKRMDELLIGARKRLGADLESVLASQFLDEYSLEALERMDSFEFLFRRSELMYGMLPHTASS